MREHMMYHLLFAVLFFVLLVFARGMLDLTYAGIIVGAVIGTILPDIDHLIYIYYLRPHELTSQRAARMVSKGEFRQTAALLYSTTDERKKLIFHTALFQIIFLVFTYFVITSSTNLLGRGIVLAFSLHLLVDQFIELYMTQSIAGWFTSLNVNFNAKSYVFYFLVCLFLLIFMGFIL